MTEPPREASIASFANAIREGRIGRDSRLKSEGQDITQVVHDLVGPETDEERAARAAYLQRTLGDRLGAVIAEEAGERFYMGSGRLHVGTDEFEVSYDDDVPDFDLVFVHTETGERFRVTIDTWVERIGKYQPPATDDDDTGPVPGPGQQALI